MAGKSTTRVAGANLPHAGTPAAQAIFARLNAAPAQAHAWDNVAGVWIGVPSQEAMRRVEKETDHIFDSPAGPKMGQGGVFAYDSISVLDTRMNVVSVVFLHLFSGYRRQGDLHHHIESHEWTHGVETFCLNIDLCVQGDKGDLLSTKQIQMRRGQWPDGLEGAPLRCVIGSDAGASHRSHGSNTSNCWWAQGCWK